MGFSWERLSGRFLPFSLYSFGRPDAVPDPGSGPSIFVIDTHLLVWYFVGGYRLPTDVGKQIDRVRQSGGRLLVPTIVLSEAPYIAENERGASAGQLEVVSDVETLYERVVGDPGFEIVGFGQGVLEEAMAVTNVPEIDDRIIAVTVRFCGADIVTGPGDRIVEGIERAALGPLAEGLLFAGHLEGAWLWWAIARLSRPSLCIPPDGMYVVTNH